MNEGCRRPWLGLAAVLATAGLVVAACGPTSDASPPPSAPTSAPAVTAETHAESEGDPVRGGQLYDTWWVVLATEEETERGEAHAEEEHGHGEAGGPTTDHPLWATQSTNTRSGSETWRCKECHGWDYQGAEGAYGSGSHFTGFPGVWEARTLPFEDVVAILRGSANPDHDFSQVLDEHSLEDLAAFVTRALIDTDSLVNADGTSKGEAAQGKPDYAEVCIFCHGPDGNAINFHDLQEPEFVGHVAADNPWEFIHKVRFGQPGWPMPSAITNEWSDIRVADVLAFSQSLATTPAVSGGGLLYDKWWEAIGAEAPSGDQPLWATQATNTRSGEDTWRCKECHGWDYLGAEGAYASGSHSTGFPGVLGSSGRSSDEVAAWLTGANNPDHDFSPYLDDSQLAALVLFLREEAYDSRVFLSADGTVVGDPARGRAKYEKTCAACHGLDGTAMNFGTLEEPEFVGTIAVENPWEFLHKDAFGHPGVPMPSGIGLGFTLEDLANLLAFAQTLPTK